MTARPTTRRHAMTVTVTLALALGACVQAPVDDYEAVEVDTESRVDPTALQVRAEGQERDIRHATLRLRQRSCFGVGTGSGFAITDRVLVTNRHVVEGAEALQVSTWDGRSFDVIVSGVAIADDLALVLVQGTLPQTLELDEAPEPGDEVTAVGYPGGDELSFSTGRVVDHVDGRVFGQQAPSIRISNEIRPGNSGGPLLDDEGRVVGVVYAIELSTDYGLVVPINALRRAVASKGLFANPSRC